MLDLLKYLWQGVSDGVVAAFQILFDFTGGWVVEILSPLGGMFDALGGMILDLSNILISLLSYARIANGWAPVDAMINGGIVYLNIWGILVAYRSIKKLIPTLAG